MVSQHVDPLFFSLFSSPSSLNNQNLILFFSFYTQIQTFYSYIVSQLNRFSNTNAKIMSTSKSLLLIGRITLDIGAKVSSGIIITLVPMIK